MNKFIKRLVVLSVMFLGVYSSIYACPVGMINAGACLPPDDPRLPQNQGPAPPPAPIWADRWGAIAADGGVYGIVSDMPSKRKATKASINECEKRGGKKCALVFAYYNQCAAVGSNTEYSYSWHAPTAKEAELAAVQKCEQGSGKKCNVYYSGCSMPVRVN